MQQAEPYMVWNGEKTENKGGEKQFLFYFWITMPCVCPKRSRVSSRLRF